MSRNSSAKKSGRAVWFWPALGAAVLLVALLVSSPFFQGLLEEAVEWTTRLMNEHPLMGAAVFFLFSAASAMLAFASSVLLVPPANLVWGKPISFLLLWGGWLMGAAIAFGIGIIAGESLLADRPLPFLVIVGLLVVIVVVAGLLLRGVKKRKLGGVPPC